MTNHEAYKDELLELLLRRGGLAVVNGKPDRCCHGMCPSCEFGKKGNTCREDRLNWLYAKCNERNLKLTKREWHLCKAIETGWIARNESGVLYRFEEKPRKSGDIWFHPGIILSLRIVPDCFEFIQWQDEEPWSVEDLLKLGVLEGKNE